MENKTVSLNPINKKDNKCFQYAATVASNQKEDLKLRLL